LGKQSPDPENQDLDHSPGAFHRQGDLELGGTHTSASIDPLKPHRKI
jgi:hypothetical protein